MTARDDTIHRLAAGRLHDPFLVLGRHPANSGMVVRTILPAARDVEIVGIAPMHRLPGVDVFEATLTVDEARLLESHYRIRWLDKETSTGQEMICPYSFDPCLGADDLYLFGEGNHHHAYRFLGANHRRIDGVDGYLFAVWAPAVERVSVVGSFNDWNGLRYPMRSRGESGVWELFIPQIEPREYYKYEIRTPDGHVFLKSDPYARCMSLRPDTASRVPPESAHEWHDQRWIADRHSQDWRSRPLSVYEVHLGSWRRDADNKFLDYAVLADDLVPYVRKLGFTHIELLPVMEHPLDESWGYQVSGYYAPTARFGAADGLRYLVDACHAAGIGVLLDWVPGHFPRDDFALARFTGKALYEHPDPRRGEHREWGTLVFDYGRNEVRNFLISNAVYWCESFHIDGLRVDAVASMLYLDYSRADGEWLPNREGGRENLEAVEFLRQLNGVLGERFPGVLTIAEESTAWPRVTEPPQQGGLGFSLKWNMGWMNDTLSYMSLDPIHRRHHHDKLTFGQLYAYSERFMLPLSHDEVVHMKGSLLGKMPGDPWQQFANLRLLLAWQYATPGKKLLFMGGEFGQSSEWSQAHAIDWHLLEQEPHRGLKRLVRDLNALYRDSEELYRNEFDAHGFSWIDCDDAERSVLSFIRRGDLGEMVCIFNMTPAVHRDYVIGLPRPGVYVESVNTDSSLYGGSDVGNLGSVKTHAAGIMNQPCSATIVLPPLSALFLKWQGDT